MIAVHRMRIPWEAALATLMICLCWLDGVAAMITRGEVDRLMQSMWPESGQYRREWST